MRGQCLAGVDGDLYRCKSHQEIDRRDDEYCTGNRQKAAAASPEETAKDQAAQEIDGVYPQHEHQHLAGVPLRPFADGEKEHHPRQYHYREDDVYDVYPFHSKGLKFVTCELDVTCSTLLEALVLESAAKEGLDAVGITLAGGDDGLQVPYLGVSAVGR